MSLLRKLSAKKHSIFESKLVKKKTFLEKKLEKKHALLEKKAEKLCEKYEKKIAKYEDKANCVRDKYQDKADWIRDHYQAKAAKLEAHGFSHLAAKTERAGELKASKIEKLGEKKALKLEWKADKYQSKFDKLYDKICKKDLTDDDLVDDDDDDDNNDTVLLEFDVNCKAAGVDLSITIEAPEGFDPENPDFDAVFEEVLAELKELEEDFPEVGTIDPIASITKVTISKPDDDSFEDIEVDYPFADDETIANLCNCLVSDQDYCKDDEHDDFEGETP
ncbi:hypothetical protein [Roseinatronobacter sp.]|uniref:hypothetical protein n=1 Tax=Roseinatronobacter sp. TaxID=1945755 RepID=UPI0025D58CD8|nr:hypothetical protein [Rhodobaca sp.]